LIDLKITLPPTPLNILLIGDSCIDVYQYGQVDRISPEGPIPVFIPTQIDSKLGMAGNVYNNLRALGCCVNFLHDKTSRKTRIVEHRSRQQIVRIDQDEISTPISIESVDLILNVGHYDAIVFSDYNKGTVSYELVQETRKRYPGPIFVDTKKSDLAKFDGCIVKVNFPEYQRASSNLDPSNLIVTCGENGVMYKGNMVPAHKVDVLDVTGAGDTFLSALLYGYLSFGSIEKAIDFANCAASITVQHFGVYSPTLGEISCN